MGRIDELNARVIDELLMEYDNWTPAIQVREGTPRSEIASFLDRYELYSVGVVYWGLPVSQSARGLLASENITRHIFIDGRVEAAYINSIDLPQRTLIFDPFRRQDRNADYPAREFFTDMNTLAGNPQCVDFGDFSIVGDHYMETGGPTYAVALHHIHFQDDGPLDISHFISDRTETSTDPAGKTMEALAKLVAAVDGGLVPNNTDACSGYRDMLEEQRFRGLGYMKRLAIAHHLEVMLNGGVQLG